VSAGELTQLTIENYLLAAERASDTREVLELIGWALPL
jgi:hypothetical protein